ncbi:MAG TPA: class I SAM-dependent methyltransferase [Chitinophagaceae bacterium]
MNDIIKYQQCPVCGSGDIGYRLTATDHTVSNEHFEIWECSACTLCFTQAVPGPAAIGSYYKSEAYVSHTNTRKGLVNTLYHWVRRFTLASKKRMVQKVSDRKSGTLLDVGAGTGAFVQTMIKAGWQVTGLEPDPDARLNATDHFKVELLPAEKLYDQPSAHFNAITLWHVLEHVHDLHGYLETFSRILKANGTLFIAVPNYTSYDADFYGPHWAAWDVPRHLYHFSPQSMDVLAERHGMQVVAHKRMWFDSFYVSMLSEQHQHGYNNFFRALWNGWLSNWEAVDDPSKCSSVVYVLRKN